VGLSPRLGAEALRIFRAVGEEGRKA